APPAPAVPACSEPAGFDAVSVRGAANGGLRVRVRRRENRPYALRLVHESSGRVVARGTFNIDAFTLRAGRVRDGAYVAELRLGKVTRRVALRRRGGRFRPGPEIDLHRSCGIVESFGLG